MTDPRRMITDMTTTLTARNATAADLVKTLNEQAADKHDLVVPATNMKFVNGNLVVKNSEAVITPDGVSQVNGTYRPTQVFDEGLAAKLGIPPKYVARMRAERPDLYDGNANGWLHGKKRITGRPGDMSTEVIYPGDDRAFLLRLFRGHDGDEGVARAMLSDQYGLSFDNLDMLTAVMKGIRDSGKNVISRVSNLSERGVHVRFECPDVNVAAPELLDGYRSPFDGGGAVRRAGSFDELRQQYGAHHIFSEKDAPIAFMGFDFRNSETGDGRYYLTPIIEMVRCTNGWTQRKEGISRTHRGSRLEVGEVRASADTIRKAGELVAAETRDAVVQWLDKGYLERLVTAVKEKATVRVTKATETVPAICNGLGFTKDEQAGILDLFIASGQPTAGGLANAVSAYAQVVEDPDRATEIEWKTMDALEAAASRR
jgi:hypothetical protein